MEHLSLFRDEFNKFNNIGTQMLDSTYHMILKLLKNRLLGIKHQDFAIFMQVIMDVITFITKSVFH